MPQSSDSQIAEFDAFAHELAVKPPLAIANIKKAIYRGSSMTLPDGLELERELFFECLRSEEAIALMRLYVEAGQDRDKVASIVGEAGGDPDKIAELLGQDTA